MKIKILLIFIISTMLMFSMPSKAGEEISYDLINQEAVKTAKNVPFDMDIILRQADQVVGYQLKIIYDHTRFTFNELRMNTQLSTPVYNSDILGEITINYSNIGNPIQGDTTLFTLNFTPYLVEDHQFYQVITLDLEYHHEITMINDTFQMSSTSLIYDHFSDVYVGVFGDISGDGIVSILDVGLLQLHLAGLNELSPSELKLLDANQDGLISLIDVTMMQLFIAHKIHYIGPKINYYMHFNTMGGSSIDMQVYDYDQLINPIPIPTKEDHMFDGWFLDEGYTMEFNYETMPAYDLILYAKWIEVQLPIITKGYGLVHGHYVGVIDLTIDSNGYVIDIHVEEYFLPYSAAKVVIADPNDLPDDILSVTNSRGTTYYAKYFSVDGILFTGTVIGDIFYQTIKYSAIDIEDIEYWVQTEENAKRYVEAVDANLVFIANQDGTRSNYEMADASAKVSMRKSETPYWSGAFYPLGWAGNILAFETAVTGTKLDASLNSIIRDSNTGYWSIGDLVTGSTLTDFIDYYRLAQRAYSNK